MTDLITNVWILGPTNLPILAALWATKSYVPEAHTAEFKFVKRFPTLKEVKQNDLFVGVEDTLTRAEKAMMNGRMLETFPVIMKKYATEVDRAALIDLTRLIQAMHPFKTLGQSLAPSASKESKSVISHMMLDSTLCWLKSLYPHGGDIHYSRMSENFEGMLKVGRNRLQVQEAAAKSDLMHGGRIAITSRAPFSPVHIALFNDHGVRAIIYTDGYNLGVLRHPGERFKLDDPSILALIDAAGERNEWTLTPSGGLFSRGTADNRKLEHSHVNKFKLAEAIAALLDVASTKVRPLDRSEV